MEITFGELHNSIGLSIAFDEKANEYASDFDIIVYGEADALLYTFNVVGNEKSSYIIENPLTNYKKIRAEIKKWARGNRRARIVEIDFGVIQEYTGEKIINLDIIEETDLIGSTIPSNEINFTLDNQDRAFNILNPEGIYNFLMQKQIVNVSFGLKINDDPEEYEYVSLGKYYLVQWQADEGALTATFTARDIFDSLELIEYKSTLTNITLYDLALDIILKSGVKDYFIDEFLKQETTLGFTDALSARQALQDVAIAGRCIVFQDRKGVLNIKKFETITFSTGYITFPSPDLYTGMVSPEVDNDYDYQVIDFDNVFAEPQIALIEPVASLAFTIFDGSQEPPVMNFNNPAIINGISYKIENPLINDEFHAADVANWMFGEYNLRAKYTANWRQNPALECTDVILVEDSFGKKKKSRITRQEYDFEGYLGGVTESRGGI